MMMMWDVFKELEKEKEKEIQTKERLSLARELVGLVDDETIIQKCHITAEQLEELKKQK